MGRLMIMLMFRKSINLITHRKINIILCGIFLLLGFVSVSCASASDICEHGRCPYSLSDFIKKNFNKKNRNIEFFSKLLNINSPVISTGGFMSEKKFNDIKFFDFNVNSIDFEFRVGENKIFLESMKFDSDKNKCLPINIFTNMMKSFPFQSYNRVLSLPHNFSFERRKVRIYVWHPDDIEFSVEVNEANPMCASQILIVFDKSVFEY